MWTQEICVAHYGCGRYAATLRRRREISWYLHLYRISKLQSDHTAGSVYQSKIHMLAVSVKCSESSVLLSGDRVSWANPSMDRDPADVTHHVLKIW